MDQLTGEPRYAPTILCDKTSGLVAAQAILAALYSPREDRPRPVRRNPDVRDHGVLHHGRASARPGLSIRRRASAGYSRVLAPWRRPYRTADGYLCMLAYTDAQWRRFWAEVGKPEMMKDPRFVDMAARSRNIDEVYRLAGEQLTSRTTAEWIEAFDKLEIPAGPVKTLDEVIDDPHLREIGFFKRMTHPTEGELVVPDVPVRFADTPAAIDRLPPRSRRARPGDFAGDRHAAGRDRRAGGERRRRAAGRQREGGVMAGEMQTLGLGFTWEQLSAGQKFRTLNRTVTEADLMMFVGVTGMVEVIFTDHTFGAEKGTIQGRFVPAALTYSLIEGLLCQSMIQGTGLAMLELNKKVLAPVRVGDTIHAEVEVTSVRPTSKGNRGIVASKIDIKNQNGEVVITYEATRMLAGKSK